MDQSPAERIYRRRKQTRFVQSHRAASLKSFWRERTKPPKSEDEMVFCIKDEARRQTGLAAVLNTQASTLGNGGGGMNEAVIHSQSIFPNVFIHLDEFVV